MCRVQSHSEVILKALPSHPRLFPESLVFFQEALGACQTPGALFIPRSVRLI